MCLRTVCHKAAYIHKAVQEGEFMKQIKRFWQEEDGIGVVEIILILVILIMIIVIFRTQIIEIVQSAFEQITGGAETINTDIDMD